MEGLSQFPDGEFLEPVSLNCVEKEIKKRIESHYPDRTLIPNRIAHLTKVEPGQFKGRSQCQNRNMCHRGCPFGAYFSSNSSTLPAAMETGNLTMVHHAIVESILYDEKKDRATGVRVIDAESQNVTEYQASLIFLCASTIPSTAILLRSTSNRFPNGLGNTSGVLGHYLMDHHKSVTGSGQFEGMLDKTYLGYRPTGVAIPRFVNLESKEKTFSRGYGIWGGAGRQGLDFNQVGIGEELKDKAVRQGPWSFSLQGYGACLPYYENRIELDPEKKDTWGLPMVKITAEFKENEFAMRRHMEEQIREILEVAGLSGIQTSSPEPVHGDSVHEMGTARMGNDPETSFLNAHNQSHEVPNLFITDGSAMVSSGHMSPSLTYMALTARACEYAVKEVIGV